MAVGSAVAAGLLVVGIRIAIRAVAYSALNSSRSNNTYSSVPTFGSASGSNPHESEMGDPVSTTRSALNALHDMDWHKFYYLCMFDKTEAKSEGEAGSFTAQLNSAVSANPSGRAFRELMVGMQNIEARGASGGGNIRQVITSADSTYQGNQIKISGVANLIEKDGRWYLNLIEGPLHSSAKSFADLFGLSAIRNGNGSQVFAGGPGLFAPPRFAQLMPGSQAQGQSNSLPPRMGGFQHPGPVFGNPGGLGPGNSPPGRFGNPTMPNGFPGGPNGFPNGPNSNPTMPPNIPQPNGPRFGPQFGPRYGPGQVQGGN